MSNELAVNFSFIYIYSIHVNLIHINSFLITFTFRFLHLLYFLTVHINPTTPIYLESKPPTTPIFTTLKSNYFGISYHSIEITCFVAQFFESASFHSTGAQNNNAHAYIFVHMHTYIERIKKNRRVCLFGLERTQFYELLSGQPSHNVEINSDTKEECAHFDPMISALIIYICVYICTYICACLFVGQNN